MIGEAQDMFEKDADFDAGWDADEQVATEIEGEEEANRSVDEDESESTQESDEPEPELTAQQKLEAAVKGASTTTATTAPAAPAPPAEPAAPPTGSPKEPVIPEPKPAGQDGPMSIVFDGLPEVFKIGDDTFKTKDVLESYGSELGGLAMMIAKQATQNALEEAVTSGKFVAVDRVAMLEQELATERFYGEISRKAGIDVRSLEQDKKFWDWVDTQPSTVKMLATRGGVDDIVLVAQAYKEQLSSETTKAIDEGRSKEKARKTGLHRHSLRGESGKFKSPSEDKDDFDAGWDLADDE